MILTASYSLADQTGDSSLVAAVIWVEGVLLGTVATTIATIAVAAIGLMMLQGRVKWRKGASVILGCFILFGASAIGRGIRLLASDGPRVAYEPVVAPHYIITAAPQPLPRATQGSSGPADNDPYAGAAPRY